jgi:hypothetical protein
MLKKIFVLLLLTFSTFLEGCNMFIDKDNPSKTDLSIRYVPLNDEKNDLISRTGIYQMFSFEIDGTLKQSDNLLIEMEEYRYGKKTEQSGSLLNSNQTYFDQDLLSVSFDHNFTSDQSKIAVSLLDGQIEQKIDLLGNDANDQNGIVTGKLVGNEFIKLEKNKPTYICYEAISNRTLSVSEKGELKGHENLPQVIVFKVQITDHVD